MDELKSAKAYLESSDMLTDRGKRHMKWLIEQIEKLQKQNEVYKKMLDSSTGNTQAWVTKYHDLNNETTERIQGLETANGLLHMENKEYEEALKFYANKENYECDDETLNPAINYIHIVDMDSGEKAREALGEAIVEELNSQTQND
jgi:hypothetical protein